MSGPDVMRNMLLCPVFFTTESAFAENIYPLSIYFVQVLYISPFVFKLDSDRNSVS